MKTLRAVMVVIGAVIGLAAGGYFVWKKQSGLEVLFFGAFFGALGGSIVAGLVHDEEHS